jgi:hypothetical protein
VNVRGSPCAIASMVMAPPLGLVMVMLVSTGKLVSDAPTASSPSPPDPASAASSSWNASGKSCSASRSEMEKIRRILEAAAGGCVSAFPNAARNQSRGESLENALFASERASENNLVRTLLVDNLHRGNRQPALRRKLTMQKCRLAFQTPSALNAARKSGSAARSALSRSNWSSSPSLVLNAAAVMKDSSVCCDDYGVETGD